MIQGVIFSFKNSAGCQQCYLLSFQQSALNTKVTEYSSCVSNWNLQQLPIITNKLSPF